MLSALLPSNSTALERAVVDAGMLPASVVSGVDSIATAKHVSMPPTFLPFLHYEYGLSELQPHLTNPYSLLAQGREWQLLRGTVCAVDMALTWLGLAAILEETWAGRAFWNSYTLIFSTLPERDAPFLDQIENLADISTPQRSRLKRGVHGYDIRALETDRGRLDSTHLDFDSGVHATGGARHYPEGAVWSFGRTHEHSHLYTEAEGLALGNWLEDTGAPPPWLSLTWPWLDWTTPWTAEPSVQRASFLSGWFLFRRIYLTLRDRDGEVIGYRRARAVHRVEPRSQGTYSFNSEKLSPSISGVSLYIEAMTQFEDADGIAAKHASLLIDPDLAAGVPVGRLWLPPGDISGGVEIAAHDIDIQLRRTVRERFKIKVDF